MAVKKKSSLKKPKEVRRSGRTSVSNKFPAFIKRDSKNLGKTIHGQLGSLAKMEKDKIEERIDRLASFPELNPGPIVELDLMGQVQYLNPSAENLLPDLSSKGPNHPWIADFEELTHLVQQVSGKSYLREKKLGNSWYQQVIYYAPEWNRIRIYGYDITERKRAEEALGEAKYELEIKVKERTAELQQTNDRLKEENQERIRSEQSLRLEEARLDALLHLSQISEASLKEITGFALEQAIGLTCSKIGFVGFLNEDESVYTLHAVSKDVVKECNVTGDPLQWHVVDAGIWADAIREHKTLFVNDYSQPHPRKKGFPPGHPYVERFMVVPILEGERIVAIAGVGNKASEYDKSDERQIVLLLSGMWGYVQKNRSGEELRKAYNELEDKVKQRTAELAASSAALQESQKDLNRAQEVGQIGSWRLDVGRNVLTWSDENHRIFGVPRGTPLTYETFLGIVHPDDRQYVDTQWQAGLRGEPYDIEHRIVVGGQVKWVREKAYQEFDDAGELLGGFGITQDITERKRAEETVKQRTLELQQLTETLEQQVQERTAELRKANVELQAEITEKKRAEETVKAEQQRFNDVLDMLPVYVVLLTPDHHVPFANRFFRGRFGESHGRRCFEYLFGRSEPCEICETYTVLKTMAPHEWEWTGPDGRNYSVSDFPFTDTDGSTLILEMGIDVTERKRAEEQLRAAQNYNRSLIEASPDPLVTISKDGKIMDVNSSTEQVTGLSRDHLIGSDFSDYFTEPEKAREGYGKVFLEGLVRDYPLAIQHVSGRTTDVLYNATLYRNEAGEVQGVFAAARDITKRKMVQEALRQNEELLRNVLELLPVGVWITDKNGVITQGNPAGQKIWGGSRYVGIGQYGEYKGWWLDTGKRMEPEEWAAARAVLKGETSLNEEIEIECFDGSHKIILDSAIPLRNEKNEVIGSIILNDDITERKRTEKALRQMQKMEALGTLAGGIAHDFNNILMPIVINTELAILDTPENGPISNYLKLIQEAANRGKDLIKQIITFSRQKEQVKAPIEIGPVIREALKLLRSSIPKTIEIRDHIEAAPGMILADPTQIHQVLMNICSNASYAMREKGGILEVSLTPAEVEAEMVNRHLDLNPGPYFRLTVADTGHGMDKQIMERIFDPFFTTKKPGEGTGMGLAVVHGIVKNHGGAITVYSEVGEGSTFNVFLPMIKEELKTEIAPPETITTGKERILLIDDEEIQIRSVQPMLERLGYKVIGKTDALEALGVFKEKPDAFDLVITDQTMPHLTGRELAEELLRIRPDIPIILCTGFSEIIHEEEAKSMGIREFIMKPFSLNEMAGRIRKSLERNG